MRRLKVSYTVELLSNEICIKALKQANYYPIDRHFLVDYLDKILKLDRLVFIFTNLENVNNTYTVQLFCCLPELWEDIGYDDLLALISSFTNIFSFYAFIEFTYKYLGIDTIDIVMKSDQVSDYFKSELLHYLENQYINIVLDEDELSYFCEESYGIDYAPFEYIKQKMLLDERIEPSVQSALELKARILIYQVYRDSCSSRKFGRK